MKLIISILFFIPLASWSQGNLVPNPSYEEKTACNFDIPTVLGGAGLSSWWNPNSSTPDYFVQCVFRQPLSLLQVPRTDSSFIGMATYDGAGTNIREYVACNLLDTLQANQYYWVEFYASVGEVFARFAANNLGIHFSVTALHSTTPYYFDVEAQVKYFNNEIIEDTVNWVKVSGLYHAQGGEQFLTIGNFNTDAETSVGMEYTDGVVWQSYYIIDDVSVIPLDSIPGGIPVDAGPDRTIYIGDTTFIGQKISNMPDMWFELNGTPVDTNTAGVYVSPNVNTTYVVTRNLNGFYSTDTVTVFVNGLGLEEEKKERYSVFPVPNDGCFQLKGNIPSGSRLHVLSLDGKVRFEEHFTAPTKNFEVKADLKEGTYFVILETENGEVFFREKIIVMK